MTRSRIASVVLFILATAAAFAADSPGARVYDDAIVFRRIAQVTTRRDFPRNVLKRMIDEDIELLRGRRADGSYEFAHFETREASRRTESFAIRPSGENELQRAQAKGDYIYKVILAVPTRRLLVAKNRRIYVDRVDVDYVPVGGSRTSTSIAVREWIEPGKEKRIDLPAVAREAQLTVHARGDKTSGGSSSLDVTLIAARLADNPDSPYFDTMRNALSLRKAIEEENLASVRSLSDSILASLADSASRPRFVASMDGERRSNVDAVPREIENTPAVEIYMELQAIEDLLTGTPDERRHGLDQLHQLVRRLRPRSP